MGYSPRGRKESETTERLHSLTHLFARALSMCLACLLVNAKLSLTWDVCACLPFGSVDALLSL